MRYLISVVDVYEHVLKNPSSYSDKVKQEILHGLGNVLIFILSLYDNLFFVRYSWRIVTPLSFYLHHCQVSFR